MLPVSDLRMLRFRNFIYTIIFVSAGTLCAHAGVLSDAPPSPLQTQLELQITGSAKSQDQIAIGLKIINHSDHTIMIQRGIEIDKVIKFKWMAQLQIQAVADCAAYNTSRAPSQVRIEAGGTLDIAPWHGLSCGSQCTETCARNTLLGAGDYQFVVISAEGQRLSSPSFTLP